MQSESSVIASGMASAGPCPRRSAGRGPRVGVLLWDDARGPDAISGMPWNMWKSLERSGCEVVPIGVGPSGAAAVVGAAGIVARSDLARRLRHAVRNTYEGVCARRVRRREERHAIRSARLADEAIAAAGVDAVFGPCMSGPLAHLESSRPVIYASDATAALLVSTYERYRDRGRGWREAVIDLETRALQRSNCVALASERTALSAVEDHGADPGRVRVVPLGANIRPAPDEDIVAPSGPTPGDLRLLLTAADPERKRLDLCLRVVRELRARGWNATLHYIGPYRSACDAPEVEWAGRLSLDDPGDTAVHRRLLRDCHLALLPSVAEMYGIAPIESAAFGRPAVVSDAGGLPTVVQDGITGRVLPCRTPVPGWADAIEAICARLDRYLAFSAAARMRAESTLNWDTWGRSLRDLVEETIAAGA